MIRDFWDWLLDLPAIVGFLVFMGVVLPCVIALIAAWFVGWFLLIRWLFS